MPFVFALLGVLFLVVAVRGTQSQMFALLKSEFVGTNSFVPWVAAILILGALGYAKPIRPATDGLILLIILVMILANRGGFFTSLNRQISNPTSSASSAGGTAGAPIGGSGASSGASSGGAPAPTPDDGVIDISATTKGDGTYSPIPIQ